MKTARIRQVKREIRVLGVAAKSSGRGRRLNVVGVVYRGGLWLDGVLRTTTPGPDITGAAVETITTSPHHPQIRVVLLHEDAIEEETSVDPYRLATGTSRPVIALSAGEAWTSKGDCGDLIAQRFHLELGGTIQHVLSVGLGRRVAARVLEVSTGRGTMPEALRVADLIARALVGGHDQNV